MHAALGHSTERGHNLHVLSKVALVSILTSLAFYPIVLRSGDTPSCIDVAKVDFANMTINVPEEGMVKLNNGKGNTPRLVLEGKDYGSEWEVTIEEDIIFNPAAGVRLRLINLGVSHITGSGSWGYALMYACKEGSLHRVFESIGHLYGVEVKKLNETTFILRYGVWMKKDDMKTPSQQRTDTYAWNASKNAFLLVKSVQGLYEPEE